MDHFDWLDCEADGSCTYAFVRTGGGSMLAAFNFDETAVDDYSLTLPEKCTARLLLHTDWQRYGGGTAEAEMPLQQGERLSFTLPAYSGMLFELV